jgi:hypothetical protein
MDRLLRLRVGSCRFTSNTPCPTPGLRIRRPHRSPTAAGVQLHPMLRLSRHHPADSPLRRAAVPGSPHPPARWRQPLRAQPAGGPRWAWGWPPSRTGCRSSSGHSTADSHVPPPRVKRFVAHVGPRRGGFRCLHRPPPVGGSRRGTYLPPMFRLSRCCPADPSRRPAAEGRRAWIPTPACALAPAAPPGSPGAHAGPGRGGG